MIFVNQFVHDLFSDVVETLSDLKGPHFLITGTASNRLRNLGLLKSCVLKRHNSIIRIITWVSFTFQTFLYLLRYARRQHILYVTNPPMNIWMGPIFKLFCGGPYSLIIYDLYPDILITTGILSENSMIAKLWRKLNALSFRQATHIITLNNSMAESLRKQISDSNKLGIHVIENWADTEFYKPLTKSDNPMIRQLDLDNKFIVGYSGSFGASHGVEHLIDCMDMLKNDRGIHFILSGEGTKENLIRDMIREKALPNLTMLPFLSTDQFRFLSAIPDIRLVLLKRDVDKCVMPSKLYTAMAVGCAIIAVTEADSELARTVLSHRCGLVLPPENPAAITESILLLKNDPQYLSELKQNARHAAIHFYEKKIQCKKYAELFNAPIHTSNEQQPRNIDETPI